MNRVVIVDNIRTGLAKSFRGTFNLTRADDMVAHCIDALLERSAVLDPARVEDVIVGGYDFKSRLLLRAECDRGRS